MVVLGTVVAITEVDFVKRISREAVEVRDSQPGRRGGGGRGGGGKAREEKGEKKPPVDLDAQMEAYMAARA